MKKFSFYFALFSLLLFAFCRKTFAQSVGSTQYNAIDIGSITAGSSYMHTANNKPANGYGNNMGQSSDDIYYRFILTTQLEISISLCGSSIDTYLHLLNASGTVIAYNDDNGPLCTGLASSIKTTLNAGTYYVVTEGYGSTSGDITLGITSPANFNNYTAAIDYELRNVDKSGVTSGILYDRVLALANLQEFNRAVADTSANKHFRQSHFEMRQAAYDTTAWLSHKDLDAMVAEKTQTGLIPIGLGNYTFNLIDTNAVALNLLYYTADSTLYDTPGRNRSPFNLVNNLVAAPLADSVSQYCSYYIGNEFLIQKSQRIINTIQIDFGDGGGLQSISLGTTKNVYYPSAGYKFLKFIISFTNGSSQTTYAVVKCYAQNSEETFSQNKSSTNNQTAGAKGLACNLQNYQLLTAKISFQGYDELRNNYGRGEVTTYYATNGNCDGVIRKPIIVIDGFDPGDTRNADEIYNDELNKGDIMGRSVPFADSLRAVGYDLIILNFPKYKIGSFSSLFHQIPIYRDGGADYIERNARVLIALIDSINAVKQGNEKLTIIGPSMGGLISRYALAYMEQHQMPHQTKLWISLDSPHKGANIPIGDQRFLEFFGGMSASAKKNLDEKIGSVAAKQMLLHHYTVAGNTPAANAFKTQFMSNLDQLGFPQGDAGQPFRKIAVVNGSLGGNETNSPCQKGFTFDVRHIKTRLFFFKVKIKTFTVASARMYFTPSYGNTCEIFSGSRPLFKQASYAAGSFSNSSGYDVAPGGTFDTQQVLQDEGSGIIGTESAHTIAGKLFNLLKGGFFNVDAKFYSLVPTHGFINTKSALAFTGSNQNLSENIKGRNLVCSNETPFDSYFGSLSVNSQHVSLSNEMITWISKEINGLPQPPSVDNSLLYPISGPSTLCASATYSISNLPQGSTVSWSVAGPVSITGSTTGTSVSVIKANNSGSGSFTLTATLTSACGSATVNRPNIMLGIASNAAQNAYVINTYDGSSCVRDYDEHFGIGNLDSYQDIDIQNYNGAIISNIYGLPEFYMRKDPYYYGSFVTIKVRTSNDCGWSDWKLFDVPICNDYASYSYAAYPNPANNELTVEQQQPENSDLSSAKTSSAARSSETEATLNVLLYDQKGKVVAQGSGMSKVTIDTSHLANGTYYLHYNNEKGKLIKKQIIVQH